MKRSNVLAVVGFFWAICGAAAFDPGATAAQSEGAKGAKAAPEKEGDKSKKLDAGDPAPVFEATDDRGETWKSSEHVGKKVLVLYFFPAAMTPGCTKQACAFRDDMAKLKSKGVEVVGISGDSVRNQQLFKKAYELNFTLLADDKGAIAAKFGVPVRKGGSIEREIDGKKETLTRGVSAARWTFIIGRDGKIAYRETKVNAPKDSKKVLEIVDKLAKTSS